MKGELDSVGLVVGFGLLIAGVAMISVPGAFILGGIGIGGASVAVAAARTRRRRDS